MIKHIDERGFFQELFYPRHALFAIEQISWFSIEPGHFRGGHWHKQTQEIFVVMDGSVQFLSKPRDKTGYEWRAHNMTEGQWIDAPVLMPHGFYSKKGAKVLVLSSKKFDPKDPDTFACAKGMKECALNDSSD